MVLLNTNNFKQIYLTHRLNSNKCYHSESQITLEFWQWRGTPHSQDLHNRSIIIRSCFVLFPEYSFLAMGSYSFVLSAVTIFSVQPTGQFSIKFWFSEDHNFVKKFIFLMYEVHTIGFQTFFVCSFKIIIDSWKFSMLLLTKFSDFNFKWTATVAIGIHPTKAWLSLLVNFKNTIWHFRRTIWIKILF